MKSQQPDNNNHIVRTNCKNCCFAIYKNNTQISCKNDRINKYRNISLDLVTEAYDEDKNFYVINKFCNLYRDKILWNNGIADIDKAKEEAKLTFDILLNCDDLNINYYNWIQDFAKHIDQYGHDKVFVHIYHSGSINKNDKKLVLSLSKLFKNKSISIYFDKQIIEHEIIYKSRKSYHVIITNNNLVDMEILFKINNLVNDDLHKLLVIKNKNNYIYSNLSYKIHYTKRQDSVELIKNDIQEYSKPEYYIET